LANTRILTTDVEEHVRSALSDRFGQPFTERFLTLATGGSHEFDAVSDDLMIVASVKSSGGKTASGRHPSGKVNSAIAELYFLTLINATTKLLVLTSPYFHELFLRTLNLKVADDIRVMLIPLPSELQERVDRVQETASLEVTPTLDSEEQAVVAMDE